MKQTLKKLLSFALAAVLSFATLAFAACAPNDSSSSQKPSVNYGQLVMSCLGDSITRSGADEKYAPMVQEELGLLRVVNCGSSGATMSTLNETNTLQSQVDKIDETSSIVSVFAGVNDFKYYHVPLGKKGDTEPTTFYGALDSIIKGIRAVCPDAYFFFITPYKCKGYDTPNQQGLLLSDYVNAIIDTCNENGLDYLNFFVNGGFDYNNAMHTVDGLHPLGRFYEEYTAPAIATFIEEHYPDFIS